MGQMGYHFWMGHVGRGLLPVTHENEITAQWLSNFLCLVDINKLLTHSISPIIIAGGLILIYDFFAIKTETVVQYHHATPPPSPMFGVMAMGHGSWVNRVMGHMGHGPHGSRKMTHFHLCLA